MWKVMLISGFLFNSAAFSRGRIKKCTNNETKEIRAARSFLKSNIGTIISNVGSLSKREKRRLKRKLKNVNVKCLDHRRVCKKKDNLLGVERNIFKTSVVLCYERIRNMGSSAFCGLADTLLHEMAHSAGVKKARNHNNGPNGDRVYRTGDAAENLCNSLGLNRSIL